MLELYGHPFSSYTWKALIALYEKGLDFTFHVTGPDALVTTERLLSYWPLGKFPVLVADGKPIIESTIIVEYLDHHYSQAPRLVPGEPDRALDTRFMERVFDNHVMGPMQQVVNEYIINKDDPDTTRIAPAMAALDTIYAWLDRRCAGEDGWACGRHFSMADIAAAPALFYADWVRPIGDKYQHLQAYRKQLLARPSVKRCVKEARPYRAFFPLGAPDRD
jgi:glutathione S-transferase